MNKQKFFYYNILADNLNGISLKNKFTVSTLNPFSFLIAERDIVFRNSLLNSEILLPDGQGIVWATNFLYGKKIQKIAGYDIFIHLMNELENYNGSCFFFGSSETTLKKILSKISSEYSSVSVNTYSPPFKEIFSEIENDKFVTLINSYKPDILFVGMTAPRQEKWVYKNKEKLTVPIIASIGAVFDFYAGTVKRPSKFWINLGLEWFIRLLQEPKRLWKRNFIYTPYFIFFILKEKLKLIKSG